MSNGPARIQALPQVLADQIAAGEVVARPASIAKELLENSLDAGARSIEVDVERGGIKLIRVRDDGSGIHPDDLRLALQRHATSKIRSLDELERVVSMGFRGEALPSIAAVSRFRLCSCLGDAEHGWCAVADGGEVAPVLEPAPPVAGTTVTARDLFFNTPARRKFLRTEKTEFRHLEEIVRRVALAYPELAVSLRHNERAIFALAAVRNEAQAKMRLGKILGAAFVEHALPIEGEASGLRLNGWLAAPGFTRGHADAQHFYVNGRTVKDSLARHALRQAYRDLIEPGRQPAYVLFLELDPGAVDVNVHPAKEEVRFRESRLIHDFLYRCARRVLEGPELPGEQHAASHASLPQQLHPVSQRAGGHGYVKAPGQMREQVGDYAKLGALGGESLGMRHDPSAPGGADALAALGPGPEFIAVPADGALTIIDCAVAARQHLWHRLSERFRSGETRSRPLLLPARLELTAAQAAGLEAKGALLERLGFDVRSTGPRLASLRQVPNVLGELDPQPLALAVLSALPGVDDDALSSPAEGELAPSLADLCWAATAGAPPLSSRALAEPQAVELVRELEALWHAGKLYPGKVFLIRLEREAIKALFARG